MFDLWLLLTLVGTALACTLLGFGLGLWFSKASVQVLRSAAQILVGGLVILVYLSLLFVKLFGITGTEPPNFLAAMAILVVFSLFPKNFLRIGTKGLEIGSGDGGLKESGLFSSGQESEEPQSSSSRK